MQRRQLYGKRIILTGATSGIGWSLACALIGAGSRVVVDGRRSERLERLHLALGNREAPDMCSSDLYRTIIDQIAGRRSRSNGRSGYMINNAGVGTVGAFEQSARNEEQVFELNFFAATELTRLAIPQAQTRQFASDRSISWWPIEVFLRANTATKFAFAFNG